MEIISIKDITKDYGNDRGVFDISFNIKKGEVFGFLGPNGAGKATTIRQMLGFIRPDKGEIYIDGKLVKDNYYLTNDKIGYLPGEINFPEGMKGTEFIKWTAELRGLHDLDREGGGVMILYQFFSLFAAVLPLFYIAVCAKRIIAEQIDNGSFSYVMSAPIKRSTVTVTQAVFLIVSVALMYLTLFLVGLAAFAVWGNVIEVSSFFMLDLGSFLLNLAISGIAFFASCLFNSSAKAAALGIGLPMAFFILYIISAFFGSNEMLAKCKYLTINSLYQPADIIAGGRDAVWELGILAAAAVVLFAVGGVIFEKKDLPL